MAQFWKEPKHRAHAARQEDPLLRKPAPGRKTSFTSSQSYVARLSEPIKNFTVVYREFYSIRPALLLAKCESPILLQLWLAVAFDLQIYKPDCSQRRERIVICA
ncbi:MAG TPA: hypothetical protein DDZ51_07285 [Planctomycetaceae bacterium]|nr:hypothetical protein [Planctomycetaceae bacterium]